MGRGSREGEGKGERGDTGAAARRPNVQKGQITKMSGEESLGVEQASLCKVGRGICKSHPVTGRD